MPRLCGDDPYSKQGFQVYVKFTALHRCNQNTYNMAAVTVVDRMTPLSSHI